MRLHEGAVFGESAISDHVEDKFRKANIVAFTKVTCLVLRASDFRDLLGNLTDVFATNLKKKVRRKATHFLARALSPLSD